MPLSRLLLTRLLAVCAVCMGAVPGLAAKPSGGAEALREVVLTGDEVPLLVGASPARIAAFAYDGRWTPIPVQVDERERLDLGVAFDGRGAARCDDPGTFCFEREGTGVEVLEYTAMPETALQTLIGPDSDPSLDADDEVVFMARFAGRAAPAEAAPDGADLATRTSIRIGEGASARYVYLFVVPRGAVPRASERLVDLETTLLNGAFPDAYDFRGASVSGIESGDDLGANPEATAIETAHYRLGFQDRWIHDDLRIKQGGRLGPDLLDRFKVLLELGSCARNEWTASANRGTIVAVRTGPVRAVRVVRGFNSGPLTTGTYTFYERHATFAIDLRVHPIPGVVEFIDYSDAALGMRYFDALTGGADVVLDALPDGLAQQPLSPDTLFWQAVSGDAGALVHAFKLDTDWEAAPFERFWDEGEGLRQCTGDGRSVGASGIIVPSRVPATDPRRDEGQYVDLRATRAIYYSATPVTHAEAQTIASAMVPSLASAITEGSLGSERQSSGAEIEALFPTVVRAGQAEAQIALYEANPYDVAVYNALGQRVFAQRLTPDAPSRLRLTLPLDGLPAGPYWLQVRSEVSGFGVSERLTVVR